MTRTCRERRRATPLAGWHARLWLLAPALLILGGRLITPLLIMAVYSFNSIRSITTWGGFSLAWYGRVFRNEEIQQATLNSLTVAVVASSVAATAAALVMVRGRTSAAGPPPMPCSCCR